MALNLSQYWAHFDLAKIWINSLVQISDKAIAFESSMADVKSDFISKPIFGKVNITAQGSSGNVGITKARAV